MVTKTYLKLSYLSTYGTVVTVVTELTVVRVVTVVTGVTVTIEVTTTNLVNKKNPYGRHRISQLMWIVAPIF